MYGDCASLDAAGFSLSVHRWLAASVGEASAAGPGYYAYTANVSLVFLQERIQADEVIAILDQEQRGKHGLNINPRDEL